MKTLKFPSILLSSSGIIVFLGIQLAESNFSGRYSTARNYISDLGVNESSALIFNLTMLTAGILIVLGALRLRKLRFRTFFWVTLLLYGIGTAGVGVFPGDISPAHGIFAGIVFATGPLAALASRKYCQKGLKRMVTLLAVLSLIFLISFMIEQNPSNVGAVERFVIYPITIWLMVFGSAGHRLKNLPESRITKAQG